MTTHIIQCANHHLLNPISGERGSLALLTERVRSRMSYHNLGRGYVATWPDGTRAFYANLADLRRDQTGEHAIATVQRYEEQT